jgi:sugar-specific transcriptional regulator TrmB
MDADLLKTLDAILAYLWYQNDKCAPMDKLAEFMFRDQSLAPIAAIEMAKLYDAIRRLAAEGFVRHDPRTIELVPIFETLPVYSVIERQCDIMRREGCWQTYQEAWVERGERLLQELRNWIPEDDPSPIVELIDRRIDEIEHLLAVKLPTSYEATEARRAAKRLRSEK